MFFFLAFFQYASGLYLNKTLAQNIPLKVFFIRFLLEVQCQYTVENSSKIYSHKCKDSNGKEKFLYVKRVCPVLPRPCDFITSLIISVNLCRIRNRGIIRIRQIIHILPNSDPQHLP